MAGHLDGITFIDSKVSLSISMCACHIYAVLAANVIKFITSMVYISVMSMFLSVVYLWLWHSKWKKRRKCKATQHAHPHSSAYSSTPDIHLDTHRHIYRVGQKKLDRFWKYVTFVYDDVGTRSIYQNVQLSIRSIMDILNVSIFKYFLHKLTETIAYREYQLIKAIKTGPFLNLCNSCKWRLRKMILNIKVFSTLSEVRVLCCILSQLNILCTSLVKPSCGKNDDSPVIHRSRITALYVFSNILDFIKAEWPIYQNIQYFIRSKNYVLNFTVVRYSLHKCRETTQC